ncbi:phage tail protein [Propioniciclava sinopodophylli]|uniref:phage tail protein n=1 Tax=Propioniciclava sinopodophylli TaxID=1837344 RepID=UPI00249191D1|nr:phage tail protein [Propioniciclava sinopodophylli]
MTTADDLFGLLPRHIRARDAGLLRALLETVASEASVLDADLRALYDDWFVETASPWVLPYLADLLGIDDLPEGAGRRAVVANTLDYRRRKGTVAVAEQVARDVVGRPARAVEYLRLLAVTAHVNHVRLERPGVAEVRRTDELSSPRVAGGALDPLMHTAEVRRAPSGRGRYGINHVWVHSFGTAVFELVDDAAAPGADAWWVHPLGVPTPLFAVPRAEDSMEHLAAEEDLPVPLRPRRLLGLLSRVRAGALGAGALPVSVSLVFAGGTVEVAPERLLVCRLEDLPASASGWHAMVDTVLGHVRLYSDGALVVPGDAAAPEAVLVTHCVGGRAVGAGSYDRSDVHEDALASDGYVPRLDGVVAQHAVDLGAGDSLADALTDVASEWAGTGGADPTAGGTSVVSVGDSGVWPAALAVEVPDATRLVLVAASWTPRLLASGAMAPAVPGVYAPDGMRPVLRGNVTVTGRDGAAVLLDGLYVVGDLVVNADGMTAVTVSQCTVTGSVRVVDTGDAGANGLTVRVLRSLVGRLDLAGTVPAVEVTDSVVSPEVAGAAVSGATLTARGAHVSVTGATVRGGVACRTLEGTDALLDGTVVVAHRQVGCLRYSFVGPGSRTPRQFQPAVGRPSYGSVEPGDPDFLVLASDALETASESGNEVGVDAHLRRPELLAAALRLVAAHLPVGVDLHARASRRPR